MQRISDSVRRIEEAESALAGVRGVLSGITQEDLQAGAPKTDSRYPVNNDSRSWHQVQNDSQESAAAYQMLEAWTAAPTSDIIHNNQDVGVPGVGHATPDVPPALYKDLLKLPSSKTVFDTKASVAVESPPEIEKKLQHMQTYPFDTATKYKQKWRNLDKHAGEETVHAIVDQIVIEDDAQADNRDPSLQDRSESGKSLGGRSNATDHHMPTKLAHTGDLRSSISKIVAARNNQGSFTYSDMACQPCLWGMFVIPVVHPEAKFRLLWMCLGFVFIVYEAYAIPYYLAFNVEARDGLYIFVSCVNAYFVIDIPMTFCTGYTDKSGWVVMQPRLIAAKYLRGWFLCDIVAGIPWEWLNNGSSSSTSRLTRSFRFVRAFRLLRLARLLRLIKLKHVIDKVETFIEASQMITFAVGIVRVLLLLFAVTHWVACLWFVVGKSSSKEETWVSVQQDNGLDVENKFKCYLTALYFSLTTMTTVGYGDIHAINDDEIQFALLMLLVSSIAFAGLMGTLMDLISELNRTHHLLAEKKMNLSRYMHWRAVPRKLMMGIRTHLLFLWDENEGYDAYEITIKTLLPPVLKKELCYHIYGRVLRQAPFFTWMKDYIICVKELADSVEAHFLERGDHLFKLGEPNLQIYMLLSGVVMCSRNEKLWEGVDLEHVEDQMDDHLGVDWMIPRKKETTLAEIGKDVVVHTKNVARHVQNRYERVVRKGESAHARSHAHETHAIHAVLHMQKQVDAKALQEQEDLERLGRSKSKGIFNSEVMNTAIKKLDRRDFETKVAARKVQRHFRAKLAARKRRREKEGIVDTDSDPSRIRKGTVSSASLRTKVTRMLSKVVEAPAYFGESCLWVQYEDWKTTDPPIYLYSARCESRGELIKIPRTAIEDLLEKFSPWLGERFDFFREAVVAGLEAKEDGPASASDSAPVNEPTKEDASFLKSNAGVRTPIFEDWAVSDLDMPVDDVAFQAVHLSALHRQSHRKSTDSRYASRESSTEDSRREDARHGLRGTFRKSTNKDCEASLDQNLSAREQLLREHARNRL